MLVLSPIRKFMPKSISKVLWGDRLRFGLEVRSDDACWKEWTETYLSFYLENQRKGIGKVVNNAGYKIMKKIDLTGKTVLEIGAGDIKHTKHWKKEKPEVYIIADVQEEMTNKALPVLSFLNVPIQSLLIDRDSQRIPLESNSIDVIITFYSLEHIHPLKPYLEEMHRLLRPGGIIVGAIPTEGGLAWGLGRFVTSRRWLKKNTSINPDKIICWEHPNFGDEVIKTMDSVFQRKIISYWPFPLFRNIDVNLVKRFIYVKEE